MPSCPAGALNFVIARSVAAASPFRAIADQTLGVPGHLSCRCYCGCEEAFILTASAAMCQRVDLVPVCCGRCALCVGDQLQTGEGNTHVRACKVDKEVWSSDGISQCDSVYQRTLSYSAIANSGINCI